MRRSSILAATLSCSALALSSHQALAQETAFASVPAGGEQVFIGESNFSVGGSTDTQFFGLVLETGFIGGTGLDIPTSIDAPFTLSGGDTLSAVITDSFDQLIKVGSGTATLLAPNAFENGVVIEEGRLRAERAEYLSFNAVENAGALEFFADDTLPPSTFRGSIFGTGSVIKTGEGTVRIEIPSAVFGGTVRLYSGETHIDAGTLEIGGSIETAQSSLTIASGASLVLDESAIAVFGALNGAGTIAAQRESGVTELQFGATGIDGDFSGTLSGSMRLSKIGANTQTLRGVNSFTEPTVVSAGTLSLYGGSSLPDAMPVFVTGGTLLFNDAETVASIDGRADASVGVFDMLTLSSEAFESDYEGALFGAGTLRIEGGIHKFQGTQTHSGDTLVSAGHLVLLGQTQSAVQVASGARLTANNFIDADVTNAGQMTISDGYNRLRIGGDFAQTDAGTLSLVLRPTTGDQLAVSGAASLAGDIIVSVAPDLSYTIGTQWTLIEADGGLDITGEITLPDISTFVGVQTLQTDTQLIATLSRTPYSNAAQTVVQARIAGAFQSALADPERSASVTTALNDLEAMGLEEASQFFSDLSGEDAAPTLSIARALSAQMQGDLLIQSRRIAAAPLEGWRIWGDVQTLQNVRTVREGSGRTDIDVYQLATGALTPLGQSSWAGFALGYGRADTPGPEAMNAVSLAAMAGSTWDVFSLDATLGYTRLDGNDGDSGVDGSTVFAQAQIAAALEVAGLTVIPHTSLNYSHTTLESLDAEAIGGLTASTAQRRADPFEARIGIDVTRIATIGTLAIQPYVRADYAALVSGRTDVLERSISGLGGFRFDTGRYARSGADFAAGAQLTLAERLSLSIEYRGLLAQGALANGASLRFNLAL